MGAWGTESCSNDSCWDALGDGGVGDIHNPKQCEVGPCLKSCVECIKKCPEYDGFTQDYLGCIVWFIRHGMIVEEKHLLQGIMIARNMIKSQDHLENWCNQTERCKQLNLEIEDMAGAIEKDGQGTTREMEGLFAKIFNKAT